MPTGTALTPWPFRFPPCSLRDEEIFARAADLGRVIVRFNSPDFLAEIAAFAAANPNRQVPGVIFIPGKKVRASEISRLAGILEEASHRIDLGEARWRA